VSAHTLLSSVGQWAWLTRVALRPRNLPEAAVERQVVADGVLPAVEREAVGHGVVDLAERQPAARSALDRHGDEGGVGVRGADRALEGGPGAPEEGGEQGHQGWGGSWFPIDGARVWAGEAVVGVPVGPRGPPQTGLRRAVEAQRPEPPRGGKPWLGDEGRHAGLMLPCCCSPEGLVACCPAHGPADWLSDTHTHSHA